MDDDLEGRLVEHGYVVVDMIDPDQIPSLDSLCRRLHPEVRPGYDSDFFSPDASLKRVVHERIGGALAPGIARHLVDHRSMLHAFVLNWPGPEGGLVLHQHTTIVDETRFRSLVAWCAITEATEANGTLHVVPGSHRLQRGIHPERATSWSDAHRELLMRDHLVSLPVRSGQAVLFDNRLVHCSIPNTTTEPRISAVAVIVPSASDPMYHEAVGGAAVRQYRLHSEFFLEHTAGDFGWPDPDGLELVDERAWTPSAVSAADLGAALPAGSCNHPGR